MEQSIDNAFHAINGNCNNGKNHYLPIDQSKSNITGLKDRLKQAGPDCEIYTQSSHKKTDNFLLVGHANLQEPDITGLLDRLLVLHGRNKN